MNFCINKKIFWASILLILLGWMEAAKANEVNKNAIALLIAKNEIGKTIGFVKYTRTVVIFCVMCADSDQAIRRVALSCASKRHQVNSLFATAYAEANINYPVGYSHRLRLVWGGYTAACTATGLSPIAGFLTSRLLAPRAADLCLGRRFSVAGFLFNII